MNNAEPHQKFAFYIIKQPVVFAQYDGEIWGWELREVKNQRPVATSPRAFKSFDAAYSDADLIVKRLRLGVEVIGGPEELDPQREGKGV
jgi:hypothetical protein